MTRAIIDTNVFVSAVMGGRLASVIDFWRAGQFTLTV
jgi:predicted nucleic acid-binding protein